MPRSQPPLRGLQLELAGALPVAFVNTAGANRNNRQMAIESYADLLAWSQRAGIVSALEAERLGQRAGKRPEEAAATYRRAVAIRSVLFRLFLATGAGRELPDEDLAAANKTLAAALPALRMVRAEHGVGWGWAGDDALDRMLGPVLFSAAELLIAAAGRPHVRQCALKGCRLFFVDRSPSGQRRWCDMKTCGNRAKSRRYLERTKARRARSLFHR